MINIAIRHCFHVQSVRTTGAGAASRGKKVKRPNEASNERITDNNVTLTFVVYSELAVLQFEKINNFQN